MGRIGGDEFDCVITNVHDMAQFHGLAGQIAESISDIRLEEPGSKTSVSASIGGIVAPGGSDAAAALAAADECMYAVKDAGRNGVSIAGEYPHHSDEIRDGGHGRPKSDGAKQSADSGRITPT